MFYEMQHVKQVGSRPFNHSQSSEAEAEYDRLRGLAREEAGKRSSLLARSQQAYQSGDGGAAHSLSEEGKQHGAKMEQYNKQASEYIFRENNAPGRVPPDTIDLHGQFVEEAEDILEERIRYARSTNQAHLHVIVGKGNHSPGHIQKIKPRVEQVCQELGLQYHTEPNEGRIYVNLQGGPVDMGNVHGWQGNQQGYQQGGYGGQQSGYGGRQGQTQQGGYPNQGQQFGQQPQQHHQQNYGGGGQQGGQHGGQNDQNAELKKLAKRWLPKILRKLKTLLCN